MPARKGKPPKITQKSPKETKVTLGDTAGMKHALDTAVIDSMVESGYEVDYTYFNLRLGLGFTSIALALIAQFWPGDIVQNWTLTCVCVVLYVVISTSLGLFVYFIEKDSFLVTKKGKKDGLPLRISSTLPRFSDIYTLTMEAKEPPTYPEKKAQSISNSVGKYFYTDGILAEGVISADTVKLLHTFEKKD